MKAVTDTSRAIALLVHALRHRPSVGRLTAAQSWLADGYGTEAELLRRAGGLERWVLPLMTLAPLRDLALAWVDRRVPGTSRHLLWRKLWFHRRACEFLASADWSGQAPGQVLCLGAGLDPLGLRLARRFPASQIVEVDRPALIELKRDWLASTHAEVDNLRFVAADLAEACDPGELGLDPARPTLVLAEGLVMYLAEPAVATLIESLVAWSSEPLELAFSCLCADTLRRADSPIARLDDALRRRARGERFKWAKVPSAVPDWLQGLGLDFGQVEDSSELLGTTYGEFVATASHRRAFAHSMSACSATRTGAPRSASSYS